MLFIIKNINKKTQSTDFPIAICVCNFKSIQFVLAFLLYICTSSYRHTDQFLTQCDWLEFKKQLHVYVHTHIKVHSTNLYDPDTARSPSTNMNF